MTIATVTFGACGVGTTDSVQEINPVELERIPSPATDGPATSPPDTVPDASAAVVTEPVFSTSTVVPTTTLPADGFEAYFVQGSELVSSTIMVSGGARLAARLRSLESGPSPDEADDGTRTALVDGLISGVRIADDHVTVDLDQVAYDAIEPSDQLLVIGQLVLTATGEPGFRQVSFTSDGQPMRVARPNNIVTELGEPVTRSDYESLLATP